MIIEIPEAIKKELLETLRPWYGLTLEQRAEYLRERSTQPFPSVDDPLPGDW
ncbi:MAG: hypothetical protein Q7T79_01615 [bacterium]|nr:hypothetical protein [bacterium]